MGKTKIKTITAEEIAITNTQPSDSNRVAEPAEASKKTIGQPLIPKNRKAIVGQPKYRSSNYLKTKSLADFAKLYPLEEAIRLIKQISYAKFDSSIDVHLLTVNKGMRGFISFPFSRGKKLTILAFGKEAKEAGADLVGTDETINQIAQGKINFDILITTPEWMPKLAKVAKILGPKGLMPNPKTGTITEDLAKTIRELQAGKTEYKTEGNAPVIHLSIGKVSQKEEELIQNIKTLYNTLGKSKIKKMVLAPTMGPSIKIDLSTI